MDNLGLIQQGVYPKLPQQPRDIPQHWDLSSIPWETGRSEMRGRNQIPIKDISGVSFHNIRGCKVVGPTWKLMYTFARNGLWRSCPSVAE